LSGLGSSHAQQSTTSLDYKWDLDGDGIFGETGGAAQRGNELGINPSFSAAGLDGPSSVTVALRVTDNFGEADTDTATVNVTNVAPSNLNLNSGTIDENDTFTLTGSFT